MIYITNTSFDAYVEDVTGAFDWVSPGSNSKALQYEGKPQ